jgi:hypothetical protein
MRQIFIESKGKKYKALLSRYPHFFDDNITGLDYTGGPNYWDGDKNQTIPRLFKDRLDADYHNTWRDITVNASKIINNILST